jgi:hypothetical protein
MEGTSCYLAPSCDQSGLTLPVAEYRHGRGNCAVVGGYVYRGTDEPELVGSYLYGDFCSGRLWLLDAAHPEEGPAEIAETGRLIASFGEDEDGELYVVAMFDGEVLRVRVDR